MEEYRVDVQIRPITDRDYHAVTTLEQGQAKDRYPAAVFVRQMMTLSPHTFFIAISGESVAGYLVSTPAPGDPSIAWILRLRVEPEMQRQGIGTALIEHAHQALGSSGVQKIFLSCSPFNKGALLLYSRAGYRIISTVDGYFGPGEDRHLLCLDLNCSEGYPLGNDQGMNPGSGSCFS